MVRNTKHTSAPLAIIAALRAMIDNDSQARQPSTGSPRWHRQHITTRVARCCSTRSPSMPAAATASDPCRPSNRQPPPRRHPARGPPVAAWAITSWSVQSLARMDLTRDYPPANPLSRTSTGPNAGAYPRNRRSQLIYFGRSDDVYKSVHFVCTECSYRPNRMIVFAGHEPEFDCTVRARTAFRPPSTRAEGR